MVQPTASRRKNSLDDTFKLAFFSRHPGIAANTTPIKSETMAAHRMAVIRSRLRSLIAIAHPCAFSLGESLIHMLIVKSLKVFSETDGNANNRAKCLNAVIACLGS